MDIFAWFTWLFGGDDFELLHAHGSGWEPWFVSTYVVSNALVAVVLIVIPVVLYARTRSLRSSPIFADVHPLVFSICLAFVLCGLVHAQNALLIVWPAHRLGVVLRVLAAAVSLNALVLLPRLVVVVRRTAEAEQARTRLEQEASALAQEMQSRLRSVEARIRQLEATHDSPIAADRTKLERILSDFRRELEEGGYGGDQDDG